MAARAGAMDRRITIETPTVSRDSFNASIQAWSTLATVWAEVLPLRDIEVYQSDQFDAQRWCKFRIRYRTDITITEKCRIQHDDGQTYNITGISELGRRERYELLAYAHVPQPS